MKQIALINHSQGVPYLQDLINNWFIEAELKHWKIISVHPEGSYITIVYEVTILDEIEELKKKYEAKKIKK